MISSILFLIIGLKINAGLVYWIVLAFYALIRSVSLIASFIQGGK